ncbi:MAG TPA: hypothetical protein VK986_18965, partial [Tepidisphaeraceae bacterium]|nr:hypothetical protein [Tepidisphaeraceae bacterium]
MPTRPFARLTALCLLALGVVTGCATSRNAGRAPALALETESGPTAAWRHTTANIAGPIGSGSGVIGKAAAPTRAAAD